jgi:hypothetical protein
MKKIKIIIILTLCFNTLSQESVDGFTFHALKFSHIESNFEDSYETNQIFSVSFSDSLFYHCIFNKEGLINSSQIYKLLSYEIKTDKLDVIIINFSCRSSLSNQVYKYSLNINTEYEILYYEEEAIYGGFSSKLKTYKKL